MKKPGILFLFILIGVYMNAQLLTGIEVDTAQTGIILHNTTTGIKMTASQQALRSHNSTGTGVHLERVGQHGLRVDSAGQDGLHLGTIIDDGIFLDTAGDIGILIFNTGQDGININQTGGGGIWISQSGTPSNLQFPTTEFKNGFAIAGTEDHGLFVGRADDDGVHIKSAGQDGIEIEEAVRFGIKASGYQAAAYFDGEVGIGTTVPIAPMNIKDAANALTGGMVDISNLALILEKGTNDINQGVGMGFQSSGNVHNVGAAIVHEITGNGSKGKLHFSTKTVTSEESDLPIQLTISDDGNFGIGTQDPESLLHIGKGKDAGILLDNEGDLMWKNSSGSIKPVLTLHSDNNVYLDATSDLTSKLIFRTGLALATRMYINESGNVGIGTTSPQERLHVNGNTRIDGDLTWTPRTGYLSFNASAFEIHDSRFAYLLTQGGMNVYDNIESSSYVADIQIPHGASLSKVVFVYMDDNSLANMIFSILRKDLQGANLTATNTLASATPSSDDSNWKELELSSFTHPVIDNQEYAYRLSVYFEGGPLDGDMIIGGARIEYIYDRPY